jgi:hypothetical protein
MHTFGTFRDLDTPREDRVHSLHTPACGLHTRTQSDACMPLQVQAHLVTLVLLATVATTTCATFGPENEPPYPWSVLDAVGAAVWQAGARTDRGSSARIILQIECMCLATCT